MSARPLQQGEPVPARLPADTPLFNVPDGLVRILDRDLRLAGIPKRDDGAERSMCTHCGRRSARC